MSYLLDTNVISEWTRPRPKPSVVAWLAAANEDDVFLSVVTFAELRRGVELLRDGVRRERLASWIDHDLAGRFHGRVLNVDRILADVWGDVMARSQRDGRPLSAMDGFLAATATLHDLTLVTRNARDFEVLPIRLYNPWEVD
ncbi:MAG TPA: type II toxin-antitoxin system VapC family toxin [Candidatus Dormibacteraeota bacterium]|nr:type II toxin-antitoxin system VapC family toxin [Candidatus Dormibacteraeota bacterium]